MQWDGIWPLVDLDSHGTAVIGTADFWYLIIRLPSIWIGLRSGRSVEQQQSHQDIGNKYQNSLDSVTYCIEIAWGGNNLPSYAVPAQTLINGDLIILITHQDWIVVIAEKIESVWMFWWWTQIEKIGKIGCFLSANRTNNHYLATFNSDRYSIPTSQIALQHYQQKSIDCQLTASSRVFW